MRSISNGKDRQLTVGIDIGSSNIRCAIGSIIPDANPTAINLSSNWKKYCSKQKPWPMLK